jgi:hypothetical protein
MSGNIWNMGGEMIEWKCSRNGCSSTTLFATGWAWTAIGLKLDLDASRTNFVIYNETRKY